MKEECEQERYQQDHELMNRLNGRSQYSLGSKPLTVDRELLFTGAISGLYALEPRLLRDRSINQENREMKKDKKIIL